MFIIYEEHLFWTKQVNYIFFLSKVKDLMYMQITVFFGTDTRILLLSDSLHVGTEK
jgi:hypothetical protein